MLDFVQAAFNAALPDLQQTASHTAPMLDQKPDMRRITVYQSTASDIRLERRSGSTRIDLTLDRKFAN